MDKRNKILNIMFILVLLFSAVGAQPAMAEILRTDAVVLVNSTSADFTDFEQYVQPYLNNVGIPFTELDIATQAVGPEISDYAVIIIGHRQLDVTGTNLDATEQGNISDAVSGGAGLVNFDNDLSTGGVGRYQFIDDIFNFGYSTPGTGSGVTFTSEGGAGYQINCWEDDHQNPVLATFTDSTLFDDTDGEWDEFLWLGHRDYPGVFAGIPESSSGALETFHCFGDVPNGTYDVFANLYHSRDWRYYWGYTPADPRTNSFDVTSGPAGEFAQFEIDTITITDGSFDIYMDYGEDLGGTAFEYFGWSWIRLVPTSAPPPVMHYITERHEAGETISTGSMTMAGIDLPTDADALAMTGSQPFLAVRSSGLGKAVQFGSYEWMSYSVKGPMYGLDDLVWRSIVWAARKPFVMQGLPPFLTMRVDDESGPFNWIHIANDYGFIPWAGLFFHNVDATEAADLSALVNSGNATAAIHAFNGGFFYYNHGSGDWPDTTIEAYYAEGTQWHQDHNIPISKFILPHYYEFGTNAFQGLSDWGVEFVGTMMDPGNGYGAPWIMNGPFRNYEGGSSSWGGPVYYADFMQVPGHPEFDGQFFNCVTEIRDDAGYEWYPDNDVPGTIGRGVRQTRRALDNMALATLFTHGYFLPGVTEDNWNAILQGITDELAPYNPIVVSLDYACQYVRAMHTSDIISSEYDTDTRQVTIGLGGNTDLDSVVFLFTEQAGDIRQMMVDVPTFSGSTSVDYTLAGPLDHVVVSPSSTTVAIGGSQQFTAEGYDADGNPIPNLPFDWNVVNGGGTINANGLFTASLTPGLFIDTVEASYGGESGYASVEVVSPSLDHFTFNEIISPQYADAPFMVAVTARDISGNPLLGYSGTAALSDTTGTIDPTVTGNFSAGVWNGPVTISQVAHDVTITASDGGSFGTSNPFEVEDVPSYYRVTSPSYVQTAGVSFPVTVTAFETQIDLWEDNHQDPVLATTSVLADLSETDGQWTEFLYTQNRPYPSILAHHLEFENYGLPQMHFYAGGIPNGRYEVIANLYDNAGMRYFFGFDPADALAHSVDVPGGATGEQHNEYSLGTVEITDGAFNLYVQDAELLSGTYGFFGWAWVRLVPVGPADTTINLWEDGHQDPVLVTTANAGDIVDTDGLWTEFLYTPSRPYPTILAHHLEYENHALPLMHFYADGIPNGRYEVFANLYDNAGMRYFYGFDPADALANFVDVPGGATGEQHNEYSLGSIEVTDGSFDLYVQDAELLSGTYGFFGWAWVRLVPENLITMSSNSVTMQFDGNGNGVFGEPGDGAKTLVGGTLDIDALDTSAGLDVSIIATDMLGQSGSNIYTIEFGAPTPDYLSVTSPSYEQTAGVPFSVTVTTFETSINLWEDNHQSPVLETTTDVNDLLYNSANALWTEFLYEASRPYPSIMASALHTTGLPTMHFYANGIPNGEYEVFANVYDNAAMRYFYGFSAADPQAQFVETIGGLTTGEQHREYSLGTVEITDNTFHLYTNNADLVSSGYDIFGWANIRLAPVTLPDTTINLWEDDHQDPVLATTSIVADIIETDGLWTEFLYTSSRPYPTILAHHREYEDYGLPLMHFYADGIPNGSYEVFANLYDNAGMRYFYGYDPAYPMANYVDVPGGATGEQHNEYSLGSIEITDSAFDLYVQDAEMLSGTYGFFGWAWVRLVPESLITMSSSSATMQFDGNGNGFFGELGDETKTLVGGTMDIDALDTSVGTDVSINATDLLGHSGFNLFSFTQGPAITIEITPAEETITVGDSVFYSATASDAVGNSWDVTGETVFDIDDEAGGNFLDSTYYSENAGDWTVTGDYGSLSDTALLHVTTPSEPICVTVQRGSFGTVADTSMWELVPNAAYGAAVRISTGDRMHPALGPGETRSLLNFDLGFLPAGVAIQSATFGIYSETASGEPVSIYRVTEGWSEASANWTSAADDYDPAVEWGGFNVSGTGYLTSDLTALVAAWANGTHPNYGIMLINNGAGAYDRFRASEYSGSEPWFEVCYLATAGEPVSIEVTPDGETVLPGEIVSFEATAMDAQGITWDVTGETNWSTEAGAGGSWAANEYTSENPGTWQVTGAYDGLDDSVTLNVLEHGPAVGIEIAPADATIVAGESQAYTATASDASGNTWDVTGETNFSIDAGAAGGWAAGLYSSQYAGDWTVSGDYDGHNDTASLHVLHGEPAAIEVTPDGMTVLPGESVSYQATAMDAQGNSWDVTGETNWSTEAGAGGSWAANEYTSENPGTWQVTGAYDGLDDSRHPERAGARPGGGHRNRTCRCDDRGGREPGLHSNRQRCLRQHLGRHQRDELQHRRRGRGQLGCRSLQQPVRR